MTYLQIATLTAPVSVPDHRWPAAEAASSAASSASSKDFPEDIGVLTVIVTELELLVVGGVFVCRDQIDVAADGLADEAVESFGVRVFDHLTDHVTFPADRANDRGLTDSAATGMQPLAGVFVLFLAADVGFVNFDFTHQFWKLFILHRSPDALTHEPSRPIATTSDLPMDLQGTDTLLRLTHQVDDFKPDGQRIVSILENRLSNYGEAIAASLATIFIAACPIERARVERVNLGGRIAAQALNAIGPAHIAEQGLAGFSVE